MGDEEKVWNQNPSIVNTNKSREEAGYGQSTQSSAALAFLLYLYGENY